MKKQPDFYLLFDRDNSEGYMVLGVVVDCVDQDIETRQVWAEYEIMEVDGERSLDFKETLTFKELARLDLEVLEAISEDSEKDRVASQIHSMEDGL